MRDWSSYLLFNIFFSPSLSFRRQDRRSHRRRRRRHRRCRPLLLLFGQLTFTRL